MSCWAPCVASSGRIQVDRDPPRQARTGAEAKRHVKKQPYTQSITANHSFVIANVDKLHLELPKQDFEIFKSGDLDKDLDRLTSPLRENKIDAAEIEARLDNGDVVRERITAKERRYFETSDEVVTTTKEADLVVRLNSLTKSTNSGYLWLSDDTRVFYKYVGEDPKQLHAVFGTYSGPVRIRCTATVDENLKPVSVEISDIRRAQPGLPLVEDG